MEVLIGKITGSTLQKNRDGTKLVRVLQCVLTDPEDIQSVELMTPDGEDSNPQNNTTCVVISAGEEYKMAIAVDDGVESTVDKGEQKYYSHIGPLIKAFLHLLITGEIRLANDAGSIKIMPDGKIRLRGTGDFALGFNGMQTIWTAMKGIFDAHGHTGVTVGGGVSGPPNAFIDGSLNDAKKENIEMEV